MQRKKPTSYSDFTLIDLEEIFGIINSGRNLDLYKKSIQPTEWLLTTLKMQQNVPKGTEKAKSELLVVPVLLEMMQSNNEGFKFFSGYSFEVDAENALKGRCDFLLSKGQSMEIGAPVFGIFEAKDDSLEHWYGQCGAEMYAAMIFNKQRNNSITIIHGAISNGMNWQFLRLEDKQLLIDNTYYGLQNLPILLGVLQGIIDFYS